MHFIFQTSFTEFHYILHLYHNDELNQIKKTAIKVIYFHQVTYTYDVINNFHIGIMYNKSGSTPLLINDMIKGQHFSCLNMTSNNDLGTTRLYTLNICNPRVDG